MENKMTLLQPLCAWCSCVARKFKTATSRWSFSVHRPILAEASVLSRNSSRVAVSSEPDHFGITEINDKSLWTVGVVLVDAGSLRHSISFFASNKSALRRS